MHLHKYGYPPNNNMLGTAFLHACHLHFQKKKVVNWAVKAEKLQKRSERQTSYNLRRLTPPALQLQIEALFAYLERAVSSGDGAFAREGDCVAGNGITGVIHTHSVGLKGICFRKSQGVWLLLVMT